MILWISLLIVIVLAFLFLEIFVLPRFLFDYEYSARKIKDRGIKTEKVGDEEIIVYEPDLMMRKYVSQYMLIKKPNGKFLNCKIDRELNYLEYEVVVYGRKHKILTVLNVKERIKRPGYTEMLELPPETAFVSVLVSEVNKKRFIHNLFAPIQPKNIAIYSAISTVAILVLAFACKITIAFAMGQVFRESVLLDSGGNRTTVLVSLLLAGLNAIVATVCIKKKNEEIKR